MTEANIAPFHLLYMLAPVQVEALRALRGGYAMQFTGVIHPKEGSI
jgi:hypothetical protein